MPDEVLANTEDAGDKVVDHLKEAMLQLTDTVGTLGKHMLALTDHVASLEVGKAAEQIPEAAREGVNQGIDTAGAVGNVGAKAIDVPLAVSEDVIHDTNEAAREAANTAQETTQTVQKARKKLFRKRGR